MNSIISAKRNSAIFLATMLLAGTIALSSPSFMTNASAQSESYYGMDNNNYKSQDGQDKYKTKDNVVVVKKINCNNVNVNVNGLELNGLPSFLGNLLASGGQDGYGGASSYGHNGGGEQQSGYDNKNSFKFVCINNNNNTVIVENRTTPIPPVEDECAEDIEACFQEFLRADQFSALEAALESQAGLTVEIVGENVTLRSFADICQALEGLTFEQLQDAIFAIVEAALALPPNQGIVLRIELFTCIAEALDIPIPPPPES